MVNTERKQVLVTGGAGFLGTNLCRWLLRQGHTVTCLDSFQTSRNRFRSAFRESAQFRIIRHDVTLPLKEEPLADEIYHLACPASPVHYQIDPLHTLRTCLQGSTNMLELAGRANAKIFQASTSEIYGDPEIHPQPEHYWGSVNPIGVRACYDEGKRCAEALCIDYHRQRRVRIKIGRIFNTYGPYMQPDDGRVIPNLICQALRNRPMTIHGDGRQTRSFCYVDDLIEGLLRFMETPEDFTGPLNLGNPAEVSMLELAERIIELTGSRSKIVFRPLPSDDPRRRCPDISLARAKLDWAPVVPLAEGLKRTIEYFEGVLMPGENSLSKTVPAF
jgi:UDP-glucuronate decarboxylase